MEAEKNYVGERTITWHPALADWVGEKNNKIYAVSICDITTKTLKSIQCLPVLSDPIFEVVCKTDKGVIFFRVYQVYHCEMRI